MPKTTFYRARYILDPQKTAEDPWAEDAWLGVRGDEILGVFAPDALPSRAAKSPEFERAQRVDLGAVALVPGLVNAHSHAFQRGIRGRTEYLQVGREDEDFWTWRAAMYAAALSYDVERVHRVSRLAFAEMALSGITTVGEFHYLHHQPDGTPYTDPNELAHQVIAAARAVGVRIALLRVGYQRAGFGRAADDAQRRFVEPDVDTYLARTEALRAYWKDAPGVSVGVAPHSIRAVSAAWIRASADFARMHDLVLHIHASEQRREVEESRAEYGKAPIAALADMGALGANTTLVHATHLEDDEFGILQAARAAVCACPSTERNLGDGFLPALQLLQHGVPICLGSDSHTNIDLWEEMRLVEYHERLRHERRNVLATTLTATPDSTRTTRSTAEVLWPMGSKNGARSLNLNAGELTKGQLADFVAIDLNHIALAESDSQNLLANLVLSMPTGAVRHVFVGGAQIVADGRLLLAEE